jgi:hypothetical protein
VSDRVQCCVLGCRRTTGKPHAEWICAKHWSAVPKAMRAEWAAEKRKARRILARKPAYAEWWVFPAGSSDRLAAVRLWGKMHAMWAKCREAAMEAAVGLR